MIHLFDIPRHTISTSNYDHLLHDKIVTEFEEEFADYVGAPYAVSLSSASAAIYLLLQHETRTSTKIPSMIPIAVTNAIINAGKKLEFKDDINWVGNSYTLQESENYKIIDSAQRVDKDQFKNECNLNDIALFSFYPTKPVSSSDGGMIVTGNKQIAELIRSRSRDGVTSSNTHNSWDRKVMYPGWKMYMNSIQADIARRNFKQLENNKRALRDIRNRYNEAFGLKNKSDHLYRIEVEDNISFMREMKQKQIAIGIHYYAAHKNPAYLTYTKSLENGCKETLKMEKRTASIPFHPKLQNNHVQYIIERVQEYKNLRSQ